MACAPQPERTTSDGGNGGARALPKAPISVGVLSQRHQQPKLDEVLAEIRLVDSGIRVVLETHRPLPSASVRFLVSQSEVVAEIECSGETLVPRAIHGRQHVQPDRGLTEPPGSDAIGPEAKGRREAELRHDGAARAFVGAPVADGDLAVTGDEAAPPGTALVGPVPLQAEGERGRGTGASGLNDQRIRQPGQGRSCVVAGADSGRHHAQLKAEPRREQGLSDGPHGGSALKRTFRWRSHLDAEQSAPG